MITELLTSRRGLAGSDDAIDPTLLPNSYCSSAASSLVHIAAAIQRMATEAQQREGLSKTQIRLLILLSARDESISTTEAARLIERSLPVAVEALSILTQKMLVERHADLANRCNALRITAKGEEAVIRLNSWADDLHSSLKSLDQADNEQLFRILPNLLSRR